MGDFIPIRSLKPGQRDFSLMCIMLEINRPTKTKEGHEVRTVKVADKTGSINLSLWDELGKLVQSGDIIRITKAYCSVWKSCLTVYISKGSEVTKVGEFCYNFSEVPFLSEPNPDLHSLAAAGGSKIVRGGNGPNPTTGNSATGSYDPRPGPHSDARSPRHNGGNQMTGQRQSQVTHDNRSVGSSSRTPGHHGASKDKLR